MINFKLVRVGLMILFVVVLSGCWVLTEVRPPLSFTPESIPSDEFEAKADNFQILIDASRSMEDWGQADFLTAKNFVGAVNASLPEGFSANLGLRSFGYNESKNLSFSELVVPMAKYSRNEFSEGLEKVKYVGGNTPLGAAIEAASLDMEKASGNSVLIIVSDGVPGNMDNPVAAAKMAKEKMGDRLCIYTVWVGDDIEGMKLLEEVADVTGCGTAENAALLTGKKALASFVEKVFLKAKTAMKPAVAPAPAPAPVVVSTPCTDNGVITASLLFDFDKAQIKDEMIPLLEEVARIMSECTLVNYEVAGHTDSVGTDVYNQRLSERRAAVVEKWLVDNGVGSGRLTTIGYGENSPKYDNTTDKGRELNRRVEFRTK